VLISVENDFETWHSNDRDATARLFHLALTHSLGSFASKGTPSPEAFTPAWAQGLLEYGLVFRKLDHQSLFLDSTLNSWMFLPF